jgi:hypothetical protein
MISTSLSYNLVARDIPKAIERVAQSPMTARDVAYFRENIGNIKSIDDFMKDDRIYRFALKAHGLEDMAYAKAFIRKALEEGIETDRTFAKRLSDKRYSELVETFNFVRFGETTTIFERVKTGTVERFLRQTLEEQEGAKNEGVRLALYFERKIGAIDSGIQILGDPALRKVVLTALGIPTQASSSNIDRLAADIDRRVDFEALKNDPKELAKFMSRFTSLWEFSNPSVAAAPNILIGGPLPAGIGTDLLMSIQSIRRGGF